MEVQIEVHGGPWAGARPVEIVERKGLGHPDTICDMLSEQLSVALSRKYLDEFGLVLHHNVDKALLAAGRAEPAFGGGRILEPIDIYLVGARDHGSARERPFPSARSRRKPRLLGCVRTCMRSRPRRTSASIAWSDRALLIWSTCLCANATKACFWRTIRRAARDFAPLTDLERVVLAVERKLNAPQFKAEFPETGEDIKVMGVREHERIALTVSCAFIGRFLRDISAYIDAKDRLLATALETARSVTRHEVAARVNAADDIANGSVYLTVTGTSAEAGDDGQTGRGNRANGLITPCRPMTLEALAGKNPVTHVGKLYNAAASRLRCCDRRRGARHHRS